MARMYAIQGFNDEKYTEFKRLAKEQIPFKVSITRDRNTHSINVRPTKVDYEWTQDQYEHVCKFFQENIYYTGVGIMIPSNRTFYYRGVDCIYQYA